MKFHYEEDLMTYPGTCINATEGGARIRGTQVMSLQEAIDRYCREPFEPHALLDDAYDRFHRELDLKGELERIQGKIHVTRAYLEEKIGEFEKAIEASGRVKTDLIRPYLEGRLESVEIDRLLSIEQQWIDLSVSLFGNPDLYKLLSQILQAYDVWLMSELSFLRDIYRDRELLSMARVRKMTDWFHVIGSFLIFTRNVLDNADQMIRKELTS